MVHCARCKSPNISHRNIAISLNFENQLQSVRIQTSIASIYHGKCIDCWRCLTVHSCHDARHESIYILEKVSNETFYIVNNQNMRENK